MNTANQIERVDDKQMSSHGVLPTNPRRVTFTAGRRALRNSVIRRPDKRGTVMRRMAASALSGLQILKCAEN
ncbi:hypothetical protein KCP71_11490 [Salmonella enterica subsp. enterica]|nr:hypothetical protein KCP71_11490 [Salmonella enterica subsp. enterica]